MSTMHPTNRQIVVSIIRFCIHNNAGRVSSKDISFFLAKNSVINTPIHICLNHLNIRPQIFGRSEADCGEFMSRALLAPEYRAKPDVVGGGFTVMTQHGERASTTGAAHEAAREIVWTQTKQVLLARMGEAPAAL